MTITRSIIGVHTSDTKKFLVPEADKTNLVLVDSVANGNGREATFQWSGGIAEAPVTMRLGHYPNPKTGVTNISLKVSTFMAETDSVAGTVVYKPATVTIATSMPCSSGIPDLEDWGAIIGNAYSILQHFASGVADNAVSAELQFGVLTQIMGHISTAAA